MDKYEYKVKAEEIKTLIAKKKYKEAVKIADGIDWSRVRSVLMLCTISDLYKINRRLEESRDILLMAYERNPSGRTIVYSLCELSIKLGEVVQAVEYYKEYVQLAPKDTGRYILQYKLYEAQDVGLEERIAVLEEFKKRDYREKWAYELAYLYHRIGLATRCVEECDDLILWFGEGKYVMKAMELKMLHQPLTGVQQKRYNLMKGVEGPVSEVPGDEDFYEMQEYPEGPQEAASEMDIQIRPMRMGQYDTINLQKELAENMKEFLLQEEPQEQTYSTALEEIRYEDDSEDETYSEGTESMTQEIVATLLENTDGTEETGQDDPEEFYGEEVQQEVYEEPYPEDYDAEEYPADETDGEDASEYKEEEPDFVTGTETEEKEPQAEEIFFEDQTAEMPSVRQDELNPRMAGMLSQEYDGQISLVVPEAEKVEKQITGQMSIEDILAEWEKMKKANEQKRAEDVRKRVQAQTGAMFSEFDASTRNGILEQLEEAARNQAMKEAEEEEADIEILEESYETGDEEEAAEEEIETGESGTEQDREPAEELPDEEETDEPWEEPADGEEAGEPEEEPAEREEPGEPEEEPADGEEPGELQEEPADTEETEAPRKETITSSKEENAGEPRRGREMTAEEAEAFGSFIQTKQEKAQIVNAIDMMSLAPCTGNVIITGDTGVDKVELAKELIREVQQSDANFSGRVAKISGKALNGKDIPTTLGRIQNGALIIEKAGDIKPETLKKLNRELEKDKGGIIILMEDTRKAVEHMLEGCRSIVNNFNVRIDIEALSNDALVSYGKKYANELEYAMDDLSMLALYTRIADRQTSEHVVTAAEVREIVDEAIESANRKNLGHFRDILLAKRYDDEDMIILREKDFIAY